jgi:hypothetical protein
MPDETTNLQLPYILASQAQKHVSHNEALRLLDGLVQLSVRDRDLTAPPGSPADGDRYIIGSGATGDWAGWDLNVALWSDGVWQKLVPREGWRAWIADEEVLLVWDGAAWSTTVPDELQNLSFVGVNGTADANNRLLVQSPGSLLTHEGAGHQLKVNKAAAGDTASLLFQTGFSGRAEMGTAGSDDWSIKVSADGASWTEALRVDAATGVPDLRAGATIGGSLAFRRANVVGTVSQSGGVPTGAVVERGSNGNGEFVRFADGTQMCWGSLYDAGVEVTKAWGGGFRHTTGASGNFPAAFAVAPRIFAAANDVNAEAIPIYGDGGTTWFALRFWRATSATVDVSAQWLAIGRWF